MLNAPCANPGYFCYACLCPCVAIYQQRDAIIGDGKYQCCLGSCMQTDCPKVPCLCIEVCCCPGLAESFTRMHIMSHWNIRPDPMDQCIICTSNVCQILATCAACFCDRDVANLMRNAADIMFCCVLGCMITQVATEVEARGVGYPPIGNQPLLK